MSLNPANVVELLHEHFSTYRQTNPTTEERLLAKNITKLIEAKLKPGLIEDVHESDEGLEDFVDEYDDEISDDGK
jgi:hypothetical protein